MSQHVSWLFFHLALCMSVYLSFFQCVSLMVACYLASPSITPYFSRRVSVASFYLTSLHALSLLALLLSFSVPSVLLLIQIQRPSANPFDLCSLPLLLSSYRIVRSSVHPILLPQVLLSLSHFLSLFIDASFCLTHSLTHSLTHTDAHTYTL